MIGCRPATTPSTSSSSSSAFNDIVGSELEEGLADFDSFRAFEQRQWGRAGVTKTHVHVAAAVAGSMERGETFRQTDAKCP